MKEQSIVPLLEKEAVEMISYWQRCTPTQMADFFYAYDKTDKRTERVVSYNLPRAGVECLRELEQATYNTLRFIMACKKPPMDGVIGTQPVFSPILAIDCPDKKTVYFALNWEANPHFLTDTDLPETGSGIDAIPPAGAFLFVFNWLAQKYYDLPVAFEQNSGSVVTRVESYIYIPEETTMIANKVKEATEPAVYIHLGVGISVPSHPFSFRPVLEVREQDKALTTQPRDDSSFFDFSRPCPPYCKPKD